MTKQLTYEVDIAEEFRNTNEIIDRTNEKIDGLTREISDWKQTVDRQLTKLNDNMERVLLKIADHEQRLMTLETKQHDAEVKHVAIRDAAQLGWAVAKAFALSVIIGGSIVGWGWALKALQIFGAAK